MFFHAWPGSALSGGFTGVDVFFVISGYLITRIIAAEMSDGSFSLATFYARRIKRIIPALFVVLAVSLGAGWFILLPGDYAIMAESAIAAILSVSNIYFFNHTGYFDAAAQTMPLLHTWSLGVEEQFYFVWPLALLGIFWLARKSRVPLIALVIPPLVVALAYSVWLASVDGKAAFYLSTSRAYELLIGAVVALRVVPRVLAERRGVTSTMSVVGAALLIYGFFSLDEQQPFPGWAGLIPTIGAALIILGGEHAGGDIVNRVLATRPFVAVGKISYSLYLWHWPVLVLFAHYASGPPTTMEAISLVALSVALATLSYWFVEQPFRASRARDGIQFARFAGAAGVISALGAAVALTNGAIGRVPDAAKDIASLDTMWEWDCPEEASVAALDPKQKFCFFGTPRQMATHHAVLWGDSHAEHFAPLLDVVGRELGLSIMLYRSCPAVIDGVRYFRDHAHAPNYSERCGAERQAMLAWLADNNVMVILASQWAGVVQTLTVHREGGSQRASPLLFDALRSAIATIDPGKHRVVILGQFPATSHSGVTCAQRTLAGVASRECGDFRVTDASAAFRDLAASEAVLQEVGNEGASAFIPIASKICTSKICPTVFNGEYIYRDNRHLRRNLKYETKRELVDRIGLHRALRQAIATPQ